MNDLIPPYKDRCSSSQKVQPNAPISWMKILLLVIGSSVVTKPCLALIPLTDSAAGETLSEYLERIQVVPTDSGQLGFGFDPNNPADHKYQVGSIDWVNAQDPQEKSPHAPVYAVDVVYSENNSERQASRFLTAKASAKFSLGDFNGAYSASELHQSSSSEKTAYIRIHAFVYDGYNRLLTGTGSRQSFDRNIGADRANLKNFKKDYGTSVITELHYGASIDATFSIISTDDESRNIVANHIRASFNNLFASASIDMGSTEADKTASKNTQIAVNVVANCEGSDFPGVTVPFGDCDAVMRTFVANATAMLQYIQKPEHATIIGFRARRINSLVPASDPLYNLEEAALPPWVNLRKSKLESLYNAWVWLEDMRKHYVTLGQQEFNPDDDDRAQFGDVVASCESAEARLLEIAHKLVSFEATSDEVSSVQDYKLLQEDLTNWATHLEINGDAKHYPVDSLPALPRVRKALNEHPLRLKLTFDRFKSAHSARTGYDVPQSWTLGFTVAEDTSTPLGDLEVFLNHPIYGTTAFNTNAAITSPHFGETIVVDLSRGWTVLNINPRLVTTAPAPGVPQPQSGQGQAISRDDLVAALKGSGQIEAHTGANFSYQPWATIGDPIFVINVQSE